MKFMCKFVLRLVLKRALDLWSKVHGNTEAGNRTFSNTPSSRLYDHQTDPSDHCTSEKLGVTANVQVQFRPVCCLAPVSS